MSTIIVIYVITTALALFFIRPIRKHWIEVLNEIDKIQSEIALKSYKESKLKILGLKILAILLGIVSLAVLFIITLPAHALDGIIKKKKQIENKNAVYMKDLNGGGDFFCNECQHSEQLISFIHGFGYPYWSKSSYQCQSCGKFHTIEESEELPPAKDKCECNGKLSREDPLFCPKCKSRNVAYNCKYMT